MTDEQVEYIAKRVAEIYKETDAGHTAISVYPPLTASDGEFSFMFDTRFSYITSKDRPDLIIKIIR